MKQGINISIQAMITCVTVTVYRELPGGVFREQQRSLADYSWRTH